MTHKPEREHKHRDSRSILFLPIGGMSKASSRLICYENAVYLRKLGWRVEVGDGDPSRFAFTIFQKRFSSRDLIRAKRARSKTILQISEARFVNSEKESAKVIEFAGQMDGVIVGTDVTRIWFKKRGIKSTVIPTGLDFANLPQGIKKNRPIKICWIGSGRNEKYLKYLVAPLNRLWQENYNFEFRIIGAKMLNANWIKQPNFIKWKLGEAEKKVAECHIGIAPLEQSSIEMTKPPSKLILYMALKLAVIGSKTPPYRSLIQNGINGFLISNNSSEDWYNTLIQLFNTERRNQIALAGYNSCQSYDARNISKKWDEFLRRF